VPILPLLTPEQVAGLLQIHHLTVLKLIKDKKLRAVKLGRVYRVQEADLATFITSHQTQKPKQKSI